MRFPSSRLFLSNAVLATALAFTSLTAHAFVDIPAAAPVVDLTGTLNDQQQQALANKIADIDSRTGTEVAMLMVPTTGEETVQSYSWRVAETWKPGHQGLDRGLVVVIAKNDRKSYLQVGRGLEQVLPSDQATQLAKHMSPLFRKGQYYEALDRELDEVAALAATLPIPEGSASPQSQTTLQTTTPGTTQTATPASTTTADALQQAVGDPVEFIFKFGMPLMALVVLVHILRWAMSSGSSSGYPSSGSVTRSNNVTSTSHSTTNSSGSGFTTGLIVGAAIADSERRSSSSSSSSSSDYSSSSSSSSSSYSDSSSYGSSDSGGSFGGSGGGDSW